MARIAWAGALKRSAAGAVLAAAIAGTAVWMSASADGIAPQAREPDDPPPAVVALWNTAEPLLQTPVRYRTLGESAAVNGDWYDYFSVPARIGGQDGKLVIARDFGASDDADAAALLRSPRPAFRAVMIGFKPATPDSGWLWARYDASGTRLSAAGGNSQAMALRQQAEAQCVAQLATESTPSG